MNTDPGSQDSPRGCGKKDLEPWALSKLWVFQGILALGLLFWYFLPLWLTSISSAKTDGWHSSKCVEYELISQGSAVEITLDPNETILAESGAMVYFEKNISHSISWVLDEEPADFIEKVKQAFKRFVSDESLALDRYRNTGYESRKVALSGARQRDTVIAINLDNPNISSYNVRYRQGAFLAGVLNLKHLMIRRPLDWGYFEDCEIGLGFVQQVEGNGMVFLHARGYHHNVTLEKGRTLLVDRDCLVAYTTNVEGDTRGTVWVQTICDRPKAGILFPMFALLIIWKFGSPFLVTVHRSTWRRVSRSFGRALTQQQQQ